MELKIEKKTLKRILWAAVLCIVLYWFLSAPAQIGTVFGVLGNIFTPFIVGLVIAFIINVPMRWLESKMTKVKKHWVRRVIAMSLSFLLVAAILAGVLWLLIPEVVKTISDLIPQLTEFVSNLEKNIENILKDNPQLSAWLFGEGGAANIDWAGLLEDGLAFLGERLADIVTTTLLALLSVGSFLISAFIAIVFAIYVLYQKELLARQGRRLLYAFLPEKIADSTLRIMRLSNSAFSRFLSGQCIEVCILGSMFAIAMAIFNMPFIPLICVLIAITAFVPYVGAWAACFIGAFLIMVVDPTKALWFMAMFLVVQEIENNLIYPKVVGTSIGLSGMWVLLAISIGGELFGVFGMIVMIPIASVIYTLLSEATEKRLQKRNVANEKLVAQPPEIAKNKKEKKLIPAEDAEE
jgi:predicted PurR-regulated permease PerM